MNRLAMLALAATLAGCGSYPAHELRLPQLAVDQPHATLAIQRRGQIVGAGAAFAISVDGQPAANLNSGQAATLPVPVGVRTIGLECGRGPLGSTASLTLEAKAGQSYPVEVFSTLGSPCGMRLG